MGAVSAVKGIILDYGTKLMFPGAWSTGIDGVHERDDLVMEFS